MDERSETAISADALLAAESRHRLGNTLQLLLAVIAHRRRHLPAGEGKLQLRWVENVVQAMIMLHRPLRANGPDGGIARYLSALPELWRPICTARSIAMTVEADPIKIAGAKQLPLALAAYELTTNAIRHAFPRDGGRIRIALKQVGEVAAELSVADDGIGIADAGDRSGAGLALVETMVAQFGGGLQLDGGNGTTARIRFPVSASAPATEEIPATTKDSTATRKYPASLPLNKRD